MTRADEYRQRAAECQREAKRAIFPLDKQQWLLLAEHWLKLAQATERDHEDDQRRA
jgi:hypothetical protein